MKKFAFLLLLITFHLNAEPLYFGESVDENKLVAISSILSSPETFVGETVTIQGTIVGVCSRRGCWVDLASDARFEKLRLKVRDGDMVFPMSAKGRQALATGVVTSIELTLEQTQSYLASIAKRNEESFDPSSVEKPMSIYQVQPVGVKILD